MTWEELKQHVIKRQPIESIYYYRLQLLNYRFMLREISKEQATEEKKAIEQEFLQLQEQEKNLIFFKHLNEVYLKYENMEALNIDWYKLVADIKELCQKYGYEDKGLGYCSASILEYFEQKWNEAKLNADSQI